MTTMTGPAPRARMAVRHSLILARRNLLHIKADPEQIVGMTVQPVMFLTLFVYVFGGAIAGSSREYLQFALPGIAVQTVSFSTFTTALGLNTDFQRGLIDRFRSLPMARSAVVAGRILADTVRIIWAALVITAIGLLLGFRFHGGIEGALGALALVTLFGFSISWLMALLGIIAKTPEAVNTWGFLVIMPWTFASSTFASPDSMPGWLAAFVRANPITHVVDATRGLVLGGPVAAPGWKAAAWMIGIVVVFAPLTIARYRRRS